MHVTGRSTAGLHPAWNFGRAQPVLLWALQEEMRRTQGEQEQSRLLQTIVLFCLCSAFLLYCFLSPCFLLLQGLRFLHFPYLLTLQLKRFDFDYTTMHRIKLNDRMTFPEELDMSPFIDLEDEVKKNQPSWFNIVQRIHLKFCSVCSWIVKTSCNWWWWFFLFPLRSTTHANYRNPLRQRAALTAGRRTKAVVTVTRWATTSPPMMEWTRASAWTVPAPLRGHLSQRYLYS